MFEPVHEVIFLRVRGQGRHQAGVVGVVDDADARLRPPDDEAWDERFEEAVAKLDVRGRSETEENNNNEYGDEEEEAESCWRSCLA